MPKTTLRLQDAADRQAIQDDIDNNVKPDIGKVGDVVYSMLSEVDFQAQRGVGWVLMDGRGVGGSTYESLGYGSTLPDARGRFLRASSQNNSIDPDGPRGPGSTQGFAMQNHAHYFKSDLNDVRLLGGGSANGQQDTSSNNATLRSTTHNMASGTASNETRPVNMTVNVFIKIN